MRFEIVRPDTHYDFIGKWKLAVALSSVLLLISLAAIPLRGIRLGIDFAGGTEMLVRLPEQAGADEGAVREVLAAAGRPDAAVVRYEELGGSEFSIYFAGAPGEKAEQVDALKQALAARFGEATVDRVEFVGPRVGAELRRKGIQALLLSFLLILGYVALRFAPSYAPGAVIALVHDVAVTAGVFVIFGLEFDLTVLAALLTIIGYSVNDTIVIYDRIRELLTVRTKTDLEEVVNLAVNQTLGRTLLTSGLTMLAVLALLFFGGSGIRPFAMAMTIGLVSGTYSTVYIASPVMLFLERRYGQSRRQPTRETRSVSRA